jgi:hypothetical protein
MKLAMMVLALTGFGLGMFAEACGGSVEPGAGAPGGNSGVGSGADSGTGTMGSTGLGAECAALGACCRSLPPAELSVCNSLAASGPNSTCEDELSILDKEGYCAGTPGTSLGTGTGTGVSTTHDGGGTEVEGGVGAEGGVGVPDAGVACLPPPPRLHPETMAGVYCPFSGIDGGANLTCATGEHCCEPSSGVSTCVPDGTPCPTDDTDWQCEGSLDCASSSEGHVCCGTGRVNLQAACGLFPEYPYVSDFKGTTCLASCTGMFNGGTVSFQVCSQDSECPGAAAGACAPIDPKGGGTGYCHQVAGGVTDGGTDSGSDGCNMACEAQCVDDPTCIEECGC